MAQQMVSMATMLQNLRIPGNARPIKVDLPPPPALTGALTPNNWLAKAQRLAYNRVQGPESLAIDQRNGNLYTGLSNGYVVEVRPNGHVRPLNRMSLNACRRTRAEESCGRPLGMKLDSRGFLVFADAYSGIFKMNKRNGRFIQLVNGRNQLVNGRPLGFLNDLAVTSDGTIFFTSSSSKWKRSQFFNIILEGEKSGRLLMFNPRARGSDRVQQVMDDLSFPNGLQLSPNQDYLLIAEGARAKIYRAWIGAGSPKRGVVEVFADNLPGFVDNIRLSPRGTYWVGLSGLRHSSRPSVLDSYGSRPDLRKQIMGLPKEVVMARAPKYGLVVELNEEGKIIRSLHDPTGTLLPAVSEVEEFRGKLYLGSYDRKYIGVLSLNSLPPPVKPGTASGTGSSPSVPTGHRPPHRPPTPHRPNPWSRPRPGHRPRPNPSHPSNPNQRPTPSHRPSPNPHPSPNPIPNLRPNPNPNQRPTPNHRPSPNPHPSRNPIPNQRPNPNSGSNSHPRPNPKPNPIPIPNPNANLSSKPQPSPGFGPQPKSAPPKRDHYPVGDADEQTPLGQMLAQMNSRMDKMNGNELRDMVLVLLKQVIETKKEANKTLERAVRLKSDMSKLKTMLGLKEDSAVPSSGYPSRKVDHTATGSGQTSGSGTGSSTGATATTGTGTTTQTTTSAPTTVTDTSTSSDTTLADTTVDGTSSASPAMAGGSAADGGANDPSAPTFNSGCVSGSLTCGVY